MSSFLLEPSEIIRINQLVRNRIDLPGFMEWYEQLSIPQQLSLISTLFEFAHQAGVDNQIWEEILYAAVVTPAIELAQQSKSFHDYELGIYDWGGFNRWLQELSDANRTKVFTVGVYLFGTAEAKVLSKERAEWCNHWWHRDLLDDRVVRDILSNPKFYVTSMKDDDKFKND